MKTATLSKRKMMHPVDQLQQVHKATCLNCNHKFEAKVINWICPECKSHAIVLERMLK